jgi:hypothetical protein
MRDIFGVDESQAVLLKDHFEFILEAVGILDVLSMPDPARASQSLSEFRVAIPDHSCVRRAGLTLTTCRPRLTSLVHVQEGPRKSKLSPNSTIVGACGLRGL